MASEQATGVVVVAKVGHHEKLHCLDDVQRITRSSTAAGTALPRILIRSAPNPDRWQQQRHGALSSAGADATVQP